MLLASSPQGLMKKHSKMVKNIDSNRRRTSFILGCYANIMSFHLITKKKKKQKIE